MVPSAVPMAKSDSEAAEALARAIGSNPIFFSQTDGRLVIRRDLTLRLTRAEIAASARCWADRQATHQREGLRSRVRLCEAIRQGLIAMSFDPQLAVALRRGDEAALELAAIPDTEELRAADAAIVAADHHASGDEAAAQFLAKIEQMAKRYREGQHQPDFARASPAELLAFCVSAEV